MSPPRWPCPPWHLRGDRFRRGRRLRSSGRPWPVTWLLPGWLCLGWLLLWPLPLAAELSSDDYHSGAAIRSEAERQQVQALIEEARAREAERARQRAAAEHAAAAEQAAAAAAAMARRPRGEHLVTVHCSGCHPPERLALARHSHLGWGLTLLRMRLLHRAPVPLADLAPMIGHLGHVQGASALRLTLEYGLAALALGLPAGWLWRRRQRRR